MVNRSTELGTKMLARTMSYNGFLHSVVGDSIPETPQAGFFDRFEASKDLGSSIVSIAIRSYKNEVVLRVIEEKPDGVGRIRTMHFKNLIELALSIRSYSVSF